MRAPSPALPLTRLPHTRAGALVFGAKAGVLRVRRAARDLAAGRPRRHPRADALAEAPVLAESAAPLWMEGGAAEWVWTAGKVHNLRLAIRRLDGVEVPAGAVLSFWTQVGRATRLRGFVSGRELREGCLVPSVGGGLCQLSNALYDAALRAGLEIVERHAHSRVVPGSLAESGRDATVFWNYVDLRLRAPRAFRVEARMDARTLTVRLRGALPAPPAAGPAAKIRSLHVLGAGPRSCASCGEEACFRHVDPPPARTGRAAHLVDECWPELDRHLAAVRGAGDVLGLPLDGRRFGKPAYAWTTAGAAALPMHALHDRLDAAARLHPESPTLADFRADPALVRDEAEALAHARRIVTPHREVAALFGERAEVLEWERPAARSVRPGAGARPRIVFPAPAAGRKGAYELRAALAGFDVELAAPGSRLEGAGFWDGIDLAAPGDGDWLDGAALVVLPAFVEHRPRRLLEALARGIPVVATPACGLPPEPGLTLVPAGDAAALREAIVRTLAPRDAEAIPAANGA